MKTEFRDIDSNMLCGKALANWRRNVFYETFICFRVSEGQSLQVFACCR